MGLIGDFKDLIETWRQIRSWAKPLGFFVYNRQSFPIPPEIRAQCNFKTDKAVYSHVVLANLTSQSIKGIKIQYQGNLAYKPILRIEQHDRPVSFEIDPDRRDIQIEDLEPKEVLHVYTFTEGEDFYFRRALIGGEEISPMMQKSAERKLFPTPMWLYASYLLITLVLVISAGLSIHTYLRVRENESEQAFIESRLGKLGACIPYRYENDLNNPEKLKKAIDHSSVNLDALYSMNHVTSLSELEALKYIALCRSLDKKTSSSE